jgi:hypothetical protein
LEKEPVVARHEFDWGWNFWRRRLGYAFVMGTEKNKQQKGKKSVMGRISNSGFHDVRIISRQSSGIESAKKLLQSKDLKATALL